MDATLLTQWLLVVSSFTQVIVIIIQSYFLYKTLRAANQSSELSRKQLYASQRPWVSEMPMLTKFEISRVGLTMWFDFALLNHGNFAASEVRVVAEALPAEANVTRPGDDLAELHGRPRRKDSEGAIIMPTQGARQPIRLSIDRTRIEKAKNQVNKNVLPIIYGYVEYKFELDSEYHYTDFIYTLGKPSEFSIAGIEDVDGPVKVTDLTLMKFGSAVRAT